MSNKPGMSSGVEVARITVKVSPDTREFRRELRDQLKDVERGVKDDFNFDPIDLDETDDKIDKVEKKVEKSTKRMSKNKIDLKVDVDDKGWQKKLIDRARQMRTTIKPETVYNKSTGKSEDVDHNRARLRGLLDEMKKYEGTFKNDLGPDAKVLKARWTATLNEIESATAKKKIKVDVEVNERKIVNDVADAVDKGGRKSSIGDGKRGGSGGGGGGGDDGGRRGGRAGGSGGFDFSALIPRFGTGLNPAAYVAIIAALALVAAPLVGLVSTLVLAIPGMISAIATPFMAISLGLDGIKKAAEGSGLFKLDKKGKIDGLGEVFDNVKSEVSKAFEVGLDQPLKDIANAIDPLLQSLPKVATGLTDMFKGFTDALTSSEGMALFDDTIAKIGQAMSTAAPGIKDFTIGMMGIANTFANQLPGFSTWLNKTGGDFASWVEKMTKVPDPAGSHGADPNGKSPLESAFEGLGSTLETIGNWVVDMAKAGMEFVSNPDAMKDFVATLKNIGEIITQLVQMGNQLTGVWKNLGLLPGANPSQVQNEIDKINKDTDPIKGAPAKLDNGVKKDWSTKATEWLMEDGPGKWLNSIGDWFNKQFPKDAGEIKSQIDDTNNDINGIQDAIKQTLTTSSLAPADNPALGNLKGRLAEAKAELADLQAQMAELGPQVGLASMETPLTTTGADAYAAGGSSPIGQLLANLAKVPPAAQTAKDSLLGLSPTATAPLFGAGANGVNGAPVPTPEAAPPPPVAPPEPVKVPAPDVSAFDASMVAIPESMARSMGEASAAAGQGVAGIVTALAGGSGAIAAVTSSWPAVVQASLSSLYAICNNAGVMAGKGLVDGMNSMIGLVGAAAAALGQAAEAGARGPQGLDTHSPSKVFEKIGNDTAKGLALGLDNGIQPVLDQAKDMSGKISAAFDSGLDPTGILDGYTKNETTRMGKVLNWKIHSLQREAGKFDKQFKATKDDYFKNQADGVRAQIDELSSQKEDMALATEFADINGGESDWKGPIAKMMNSAARMPMDFMKATSQQAMQDLGMSGGGLLGALTDYGSQLGDSIVFNVGNMDDALTASQRIANRQGIGVIGR